MNSTLLKRSGIWTFLLLSLLFTSGIRVFSQQTLESFTFWSMKGYVHLPGDYTTTGAKTYPLILFFPGLGEATGSPGALLNYGPSKFVAAGHNMEFMVDGVLEKPIVISVQTGLWPAASFLDQIVEEIFSRYRVDKDRVYLTGLSMGGQATENYGLGSAVYAKKVTAIVAMHAVTVDDSQMANPYAVNGGKWWGIEGVNDLRAMSNIYNSMNAAVPGSAKYSLISSGDGTGHNGWNRFYDPAPRSKTPAQLAYNTIDWLQGEESIYIWMLKQKRNSTPPPPVNAAPTANAGAPLAITLPISLVTLSGSGADTDGTIVSYSWSKISGPSSYLIVTPALPVTLVTGLTAGNYQFQLTVTDDKGATGTAVVNIAVNAAPNVSPTADAGGNKNITLPTNTVTLNGSGADTDGTIASYEWTKLTGPASFTIASPAQASTVINNLAAGTYTFQLKVTDDRGGIATSVASVVVNPAPNVAPSANSGGDKNITLPTNSVTLNGSGTDTDGTIASYSWTKLTGPASFSISTPAQSTTLVNNLVAGTYTFQLRVTDNSAATATAIATVVVNPAPNVAPSANAGGDKNITLPSNSVTLTGSGTDTDGTIASYEWTKLTGPSSFNIATPAQGTTVIDNLIAGTYTFQLKVTDNQGATGTSVVTIIVNAAPNVSPTANTGGDKNITLPINSVTLTGSGNDTDGTISSYEWTKLTGPASFNITTPAQGATLVNNLVAGTYTFQLKVTDNQGATATAVATVIVNPAPNVAPTANAGGDKNITLPSNSVTLTGTGTDTDGTIASYEWTKLTGPSSFNISTPAQGTTVIDNLIAGTYTFQLKVTDNQGATGTSVVTIIVNAAPNVSPVANAGGDKNITLPVNTVTLNGSGTDTDGAIASYEWTKLTGSASFTIASPSQAITAVNNLAAGIYTFQLKVTDNQGASSTSVITLTVNAAPNGAPIANAGGDKNITLPTNSVTLAGSGTDADGSIVSYEWTKLTGPSSFNIATPAQGTTIINNLVAGTYTFQLKVTDNEGATATSVVTIVVNPAPNVAPVADAGGDKNITLPVNTVTLNGSGTDTDGTIASSEWTKLTGPASFTIASPSQAITAVNNLAAGIYTFQLKVTDNQGASSTSVITVTVNAAPNGAPIANAGGDKNITLPTNSVTLAGSGTDTDGTIASYEWTKLTGPSSFNIATPAQGTTVINNLVAGTYTFQIKVTDNEGSSATSIVTVIVNPAPNVSPTADGGGDQNITLPVNTVTLNGSGTDTDGTIASYEWTKLTGPASFTIASPSQAITAVNNLAAGIYTFQLKVTDNQGASSTSVLTVTVNAAPNGVPIANAGGDKNITLPVNTVTLNGSGTDTDGTIASYEWTKLTGPASFTIASPSQATTAVNNLVAGIYTFQLKVTDNQGVSSTSVITVTVNAAPNGVPIANAGGDKNITLPVNTVTLNGSGTDTDGTIASYEWTKLTGPSSFNIATPAQGTTVINNLVAGTYTFQLKVTDNEGATATSVVTIIVNTAPNVAPVADAGGDKNITLPVNTVTLNGSGTDTDGTIASYEWTKLTGPATFTIETPASAGTVISGLVTGTYTFQLKVTDNNGASATAAITIVVNRAPNKAPVAKAGDDRVVTLPIDKVILDGSASHDEDGAIVSYNWSKIQGPNPFTILNSNTAQPVLPFLSEGIYIFELTVTDNDGASSTDRVQVEVKADPATNPVANAGEDQLISLPQSSITLDGKKSSDLSGIVVAYSWKQLEGPSEAAMVSPGMAVTVVKELIEGEYTFELTVTNARGFTSKDIVKVKVSNNIQRSLETLTLFPNPVKTTLNIKYDSDHADESVLIKLYNTSGALLSTKTIKKSSYSEIIHLDVDQLGNGVYFVEFTVDGKKKITKKIVKN